MKTAIFINTYAKMANYDLGEISQLGIKLVAIISKDDFEKFKEKYDKYFSSIFCSPEPEDVFLEKINHAYAQEIVKEEASNSDYVRIICQSEDNLLLAASLRDKFNIPGMGYKKTLLFRDKVLMKNALIKSGVRVPKYKAFNLNKNIDAHNHYDQLVKEFGTPFVLKPTKLLGGIGVSVVDTIADFKKVIDESSGNFEYEIEEYISGNLYHCDSIRQNGETIFVTCCQYTNPNFDFQFGKSVISFPLKHDNPITNKIFIFNENVLNTLSLKTGISHLEFFISDSGEIVFLEVAARSPGAIATPMYRKSYGIGFEDTDFKMAMEISFKLIPTYKRHYLSGILPAIPGVVNKLVKPKISSEYTINWLVKAGDELPICKGLRDKSATIEAWNEDYDALLKDFEILKNFQCVQI